MNKILNKKIIYILIIYILCFTYSFFISTVYNDEIWNYGFAYNISKGLIPYKDFNLIVTPLYSFLAAIFIKIFGGYLMSLHIFNCIIMASIIFIFYDKLKLKSFIIIPFIFSYCYPNYNILSVLIIILIINFLDKNMKNKDYILGFVVGLMFLTKQTIGISLFIPLIYYSKNKLKSLISFLFPNTLLLIYLILNNSLYEFIDYCFLGLLEFGNSNSILLCLPIEIVICSIIVYRLIKSKFKNSKLFYLLMFQIVTVPIFDDYHFMIGFIPVLYYFLATANIEKYKIKYYTIISLFFCSMWNFVGSQNHNINLHQDKNSYLYGRNIPDFIEMNNIADYINECENKYEHIYIFSKNAYYIKLKSKYKIDKYDLINDGNMGYKGSNKYIKEIDKYCKKNRCMFILDTFETKTHNQTNSSIMKYSKKYKLKENIGRFNIYTN